MSEILELENECFPSGFWNRSQILSHLNSFSALGIYSDNLLSAYVLFSSAAEETEIFRIGTRVRFRRKGLSGKLIQELEKISASILLEVSSRNIEAQRLYEKSGFRLSGRRKKYYSDDSDALIFKKIRA
ncbi:MAG TPA: GNAT family N-acetyltransferase [Leptospiraceae bacterium]|nr:GNAT family N-acetyltransferase [Leptospiraceae bacterium]HNN06605.1 GNAT family N-acetyltransferase [Leptospiraceae bacterium]